MNCKFCNSGPAIILKKVKSPFIDLDYTLYYCNKCDCRFFDLREHDINLEGINEDYSSDRNQSCEKPEFVKKPYWSRQVERINKLAGRKITSALDIGCRTGEFLLHYPDDIIREGVELSESSAQLAKSRGLVVHQDFVENVDFNRQYDVVSCYAVIEHLEDPLKFIDVLSQVVTPGGLLVIMYPDYKSLKTRLIDALTQNRWHMYSPPLHLNFFSEKFIDDYLARCNFKLLERYWTSGGMFNPFIKIPFVRTVMERAMHMFDEYTFFNKIRLFDHAYSYYLKVSDGTNPPAV